jgi:hypothetical protein
MRGERKVFLYFGRTRSYFKCIFTKAFLHVLSSIGSTKLPPASTSRTGIVAYQEKAGSWGGTAKVGQGTSMDESNPANMPLIHFPGSIMDP